MSNLNKVMLMGRLGSEPEVRQFEDGNSIATVSLATNERWKNQDGEQQTHTEWHNLVFKGRLAEIAAEYLTKGSPLFIEGRLRTHKYEDAEGIIRYSTKILVDNLQMLGKKDEAPNTSSEKSKTSSGTKRKDYLSAKNGDLTIDGALKSNPEFFDNDVPF